MKVQFTRMVKLMLALGVDTAGSWDKTRLLKKIAVSAGGLKKYHTGEDLKDENLANLYDDVVAAQEAGQELEVEGDKEATPKKAAPKPAAKKADDEEPAPKRTRQPADPDRPPPWKRLTEFSDRGPGKIKTLVEFLIKAGKTGKHLTKEAALDKMKAAFPDDDSNKMRTTVNNQIPTRLRDVRGIHVWRSETGYYIDPDTEGKKPQPKASKPQAAPKKAANKEEPKPAPKSSNKANPPAAKTTAKKAAAKPAGKKPAAKAPAKKPAAKKAAATA